MLMSNSSQRVRTALQVCIVLLGLAGSSSAYGQQYIRLAVDPSAADPWALIGDGAILVFTGQIVDYAFVSPGLSECGAPVAPALYPIQQVVVIRRHQRAQLVNFLVLDPPERVAPGTRVTILPDVCVPVIVDRGDGPSEYWTPFWTYEE